MIISPFSLPAGACEACFAEIKPGGSAMTPPLCSVRRFACPGKFFHHSRGYTLIELVIVLVLLGLIVGITVPKFRQALLSDSLDATSLRLIGLVRDLRERAISSHVPYTLHLDVRDGSIWYVAGNATDEEQEEARARAYELPADVSIRDVWSWRNGTFYNEAAIRFSRKGYVEQAIIHLESEDGRQISLELTPFLGSVKIHEGYIEIDRG